MDQTDYLLRRDWRPALDQVRQDHPRAQLLFRLNISHGVREAEVEDTARLHLPVSARAA